MGLMTFLVADVTFDIFGMTVDTIFICFAIDHFEHVKTEVPDHPPYMSRRLMVWLTKYIYIYEELCAIY